MLRDLFKFWWRPDNDSAAILCIIAAEYLSVKSRRQIADYMHSMNQAEAAGGGDE